MFVSYSRGDLEYVRNLERQLAAHGKDVWVDLDDIPKTADWRASIERGIESAKAVVAVLSPSFVASQVCGEETRVAIRLNKRLIPVLREDVSPEQLVPELNVPNWIRARPDDDTKQAVEELVRALETDLAWLDQHARLLVRAGEWERHDRDRSFLLRGSDLEAAGQWFAVRSEHQERPTDLQEHYIVASKKAARQRRRIGIAAAIAAVAAPILGIAALQQRQEATEQSSESRSRRLAAAAIDNLAASPSNALRLALQAVDTARTPEAVASASRGRVVVTHSATGATLLTLSGLGRGIEGSGPQASLSRDGRWLVTSGYEDAASVWAIRARAIPIPKEGDTCAVAVGLLVATCDPAHSSVSIWVPGAARPLRTLEGYVDIAPSGDRRRVFLTSERTQTTIELDVATSRVVRRYRNKSIVASGLSPDGRLAYVPGENGVGARVVDASTGNTRLTLPLGAFGFAQPAFDADAERLVTSHRQETVVRVWDVADGTRLAVFGPFAAPVEAIAVSPSGNKVATASGEIAQIWDVPPGSRSLTLPRHREFILGVSFSDDGDFIATAGGDGVARVWTAGDRRPVATFGGHQDALLEAAFVPNTNAVVTAGFDGAVIVYECAACAPESVVVRRARVAQRRGLPR